MSTTLVIGNRERARLWARSEKGKANNRAYYEQYKTTPKYKYTQARNHALRRGVGWEFDFDTWYQLWLDSGHWEERSPTGYCMCRYGDEGTYSPTNVYIATATKNKQDAWANGKIKQPPIGAKKGKKYGSRETV